MSDNPAFPAPHSGNPEGKRVVDFGFRSVGVEEKKPLVRAVFDSVAPRYDIMNDLMSLGVHRVWKRIFIGALAPRPNRTLLDLAGGTGDISFGWRRLGGGPVLLSDINASMLAVAQRRAVGAALIAGISPLVADAERLPLRDCVVDTVAIAFGLRNCTDKEAVFAEAHRVLKPGGRFLCLEFSRLQVAVAEPLYEAWSFRVLPRLGQLMARDRQSYQYLAESIRMFPDQQTLAAMMRRAGLQRVEFRNLSGGIAAIHTGWRL